MDLEVCALCQDEGWYYGLSYWLQMHVLLCGLCDWKISFLPEADEKEIIKMFRR